ncbi:hypothetical protein WDW89_16680 [Deltaproteobacteria bacterium TL4]
MLNIPDEKLKLTIRPGLKRGVTLPVDIAKAARGEALSVAKELRSLQQRIVHADVLKPVLKILQTRFVDRLFRNQPVDAQKAVLLQGENKSQLHCEVFNPGTVQSCRERAFIKRTNLRIQRTLLNLKELRKAYPDNLDLEELGKRVSKIPANLPAMALRREVLKITLSHLFSTYLHLKERFVKDWVEKQNVNHGQANYLPLGDTELNESMRALQEQKPQIEGNPEVLKYKDQEFFRFFNAEPHKELNSDSLDFWKTDGNRDAFIQFVQTIRSAYPENRPCTIFRFDNSFTYLLCGFSDQCITDALKKGEATTSLHAKILMRKTNQTYKELTSYSASNKTLYHNCLKEALFPFVHHLNRHLQINLPESFLKFFQI